MPARDAAVESDAHEAALVEQGEQAAPTGERFVQMMQDAHRFDQAVAGFTGLEAKQVGLGEAEVRLTEVARLAGGVGERAAAEIDGQDLGLGEASRHIERVLAGAAAGDQDLQGLVGDGRRFGREMGEELAQDLGQRAGDGLTRAEPARVGIVLVLLAHRARGLVVDRRQARQRHFDLALGLRLAQMNPFEGCRPVGRCGQALGLRQLRQRSVHREAEQRP